MTAFDRAFTLLKNDECEECGEGIPNGKQYGCERCGRDFCEECLMDDQYGHTGFRGEIDKDHPAYEHLDGAHCGECASEIAQEVEDEAQYDAEEAEIDDEMQIEDLPEEQKKLHFANKISEILGIEPPNPFSEQTFTDFTDEWKSEDVFDQAWRIVKIDEGMWEEIYAPLLAQTTGMGDLESARFTSDFVPTQLAIDNIRARVDSNESDVLIEQLMGNKGDHRWDVDSLVENILEEGFNPLDRESGGWNRSGRPDPTFEFHQNRMQQFEGNHRILALDKLGAPYVPYMGYNNYYVDRYPEGSNPHSYALGDEYTQMAENAAPYSLGAYIDRGHITVPPSYLYGREMVPGMGRLLPVNTQTGKPMDMLSHLDEGRWIDDNDTDIRAWKQKPSWQVSHDDL